MPMPEISVASSIEDAAAFDAIVVVTPDVAALELSASASASAPVAAAIGAALSRHRAVDKTLGDDGTATLLVVEAAPGGRVVVAGVGSRSGEGADVRLWGDAAASGVVRARGAGASRPLLLLHGAPDAEASCSSGSSLPPALAVALLGVLQALYEPLQAREHEGDDGRVKLEPVQQVGFVPPPSCACSHEQTALFVRRVRAIESGRRLARDVGNSDPERMTPQQCAAYIQQSLEGLPVSVQVVSDVAEIEREYPLAYAVARGSLPVERHHPRIVRLEYVPAEGTVDETLLFSAKGIVYDTGGADIKTGGIMAGMHLDKAGACNVAGFLKTVGLLRPAGLRVVAELGFVRNSCGSDSYVSDEIVRSHAGKRVQVLNTDAEGRMVLSDMLSHLRERVLQDRDAYPNPRFFTCATLTGHASRAVGPYTIGMDNSVAHKSRLSFSLQDVATEWGEPIEVSILRREDFRWAKPKNKKADVLQMGTGPAQTRGHQYGASFLILSSGFDSHGSGSEVPLSYTHLDIAGSAAEGSDYKFGKATAVPLVGLTARFVLPRPSTA